MTEAWDQLVKDLASGNAPEASPATWRRTAIRLAKELAAAKAELTALKEPPKVVVRPAFYINPDDYPEEDMESP